MTGHCKSRGCPEPVVGHSVTGSGKVCKRHNEQEWSKALRSYWPEISARLARAAA